MVYRAEIGCGKPAGPDPQNKVMPTIEKDFNAFDLAEFMYAVVRG
jgi:hypothetical protein